MHGFDLVFGPPKSVSLLRALSTDEVLVKALTEAHNTAVDAAMDYLYTHAGYTRVHNSITGNKDLVRLPGLVAAAYQHETSRAGDPTTRSPPTRDRQAGKDTLLVSDAWDMVDELNIRIHNDNDGAIPVYDADHKRAITDAPVRNGQRWQIDRVDPATGRVAARRLTDGAHATYEGDYLRTHVHLGYAVTVHAAQGATTDTTHTLLSGERAHKALAYVGLTRGREANHAYLYTRDPEDADHAHTERTPGVHVGRRGTARDAAALLTHIVGRDTRDQTAAVAASDTNRELLTEPVVDLLDQRTRARAAARIAFHRHTEERALAADRARAERALAAELPMLAAEVTQIEASWQRSPATVYPPPTHGWEDLDDPTRDAVTTITASMQNTHVLTLGDGADRVTDLLDRTHTATPTATSSAAAELLERRNTPRDSYRGTQAEQHRWAQRLHTQERNRSRDRDRRGFEL